jgi:uncharacterized protein YndB with AHSA1/START domain
LRAVTVNVRTINASPEAVWGVLSDGWLYPLWVVGASRMRDVDASWPEVGSRLHHSVGVWPGLIDDNTEVLESEPEQRIKLRAKGWPMGEAEVILELEAASDGTRVKIYEKPVKGPGVLVPSPLVDPMLKWRNTETLRRLAYVVEGRTGR